MTDFRDWTDTDIRTHALNLIAHDWNLTPVGDDATLIESTLTYRTLVLALTLRRLTQTITRPLRDRIVR